MTKRGRTKRGPTRDRYMDLVLVLVALLVLLVALNMCAWGALWFVVANLYLPMRAERDALFKGRDGWRGVAERTLVVARTNEALLKRATELAAASLTGTTR
jgi:phosphatidylglycerophosphate synthase